MFHFGFQTEKEKIISEFYKNYPEIPYISDNRRKDWPAMARQFPSQCIISRETMTRFQDGLLPGHVYMLYWMNKYKGKKVPEYFEYKYGISFDKELVFLSQNGYINNGVVTDRGMQAVKIHKSVIENHAPKKDVSSINDRGKKATLLAKKDYEKKRGIKYFQYISEPSACEKCKNLNNKIFKVEDLQIGVNAPPMCDHCRCTIAPYIDEKAFNKWLNKKARGK